MILPEGVHLLDSVVIENPYRPGWNYFRVLVEYLGEKLYFAYEFSDDIARAEREVVKRIIRKWNLGEDR